MPDHETSGDQEILGEIGRMLQLDDTQLREGHAEEEWAPFLTNLQGEVEDRIGHFEIVRELGEGGFAKVYEARQRAPVDRRVALKIMKTGRLTPEGVARFSAERQALALMEHPNIATIHEAGTTAADRPYFAMEYIDGEPLTVYCDCRRLSGRQRLHLLIKVCEAVQHAHQRGIIHRDLKPSNILVTEQEGRPDPKIIDFGIAKATEGAAGQDVRMTAEHQVMGTLAYSSPEQLEHPNRIDTRTDIYALGALAYELLTGTTPHLLEKEEQEISYASALLAIRDHEPEIPSRRFGNLTLGEREIASKRRRTTSKRYAYWLKGDLDWIVRKAIAREPDRRYESAIALARDLAAFLTNQPVQAAGPGRIYRARKFVRRHRGTLTAAAIVALSLIGGTVVSVYQAGRAREALVVADINAQAARAVNTFLYEDLLGGGAYADGSIDSAMSFKALIDRASARLENRLDDQPVVKAEIHWILGDLYDRLGESESAATHLRQAVALGTAHLGPEAEPTIKYLDSQGSALANAGKEPDAEAVFERLLEIAEPESKKAHEWRLRLAKLWVTRHKRFDEAAEICLKVIQQSEPTDAGLLARAKSTLATVYRQQGRLEDAEPLLQEALAIAEDTGINDPTLIRRIRVEQARLAMEKGQAEDSVQPLLQTLEQEEDALTDHSIGALGGQLNLALAYINTGEFDKAKAQAATLIKHCREHWPDHPFLWAALRIQAICYELEGDVDGAEATLEKAMLGQDANFPPDHEESVKTAMEWGHFLVRHGQYERAVEHYADRLRSAPSVKLFYPELERSVMLSTRHAMVVSGEFEATEWHYLTSTPEASWYGSDYDHRDWETGATPFGSPRPRWAHHFKIRTEWTTPDVWMRRSFTLESVPNELPRLHLAHAWGVEIFVNGVRAFANTVGKDFDDPMISTEAHGAMHVGTNVIAVRCRESSRTNRYVDVGLYTTSQETDRKILEILNQLIVQHPNHPELSATRISWLGRAGRWNDLLEEALIAFRRDGSIQAAWFEGAPAEIQSQLRHLEFKENDAAEDALADSVWDPDKTQTLIRRGADWHYHDGGQDLGTQWRSKLDESWSRGPSPLGYGESDVRTEVSYGEDTANKLPTTYFARSFQLDDSSRVEGLKLRLRCDDGAALFLNSHEIARVRLPSDATYESFGNQSITGDEERRYVVYHLDPQHLKPGENLIAVELHQSNRTSSDLFFDLALETLVE